MGGGSQQGTSVGVAARWVGEPPDQWEVKEVKGRGLPVVFQGLAGHVQSQEAKVMGADVWIGDFLGGSGPVESCCTRMRRFPRGELRGLRGMSMLLGRIYPAILLAVLFL